MFTVVTLYRDSFHIEQYGTEADAHKWATIKTKSAVSKAVFLYGPNGLITSNVNIDLGNNFRTPFNERAE